MSVTFATMLKYFLSQCETLEAAKISDSTAVFCRHYVGID